MTPLAPRRMGLRRRLAVLLGLAAAVLVVAAVVLVTSLLTLGTQREQVVGELDPAVIASRDLRAAMIDQETGIRGFVITGDPSFLEPYDRGQSAELSARSVLEPVAAADPSTQAAFEAVTAATDAWQTGFAGPAVDATIADPVDPSVGSESAQTDAQALFDEVRRTIDDLERNLNDRRDASVVALDEAGQRVWSVAIGALIGVVALGIVIAVALKRSVTDPIIGLAAEVRAVAAGDLDRTVEVEGSPELERLASDIDGMRRQILGELERLERARAEVEQRSTELARSNADLEQFAYVASHDLQEPLRKIAGFCQLLERRYRGQLDDRADEYIGFVVDGAKRMQDLINDLLAFSRVGRTTDRFEDVDLGELAAEVVGTLGPAIDAAGGEVVVGPLPVVRGDRRLLAALLQNLVGNAVKFRGPAAPVVRLTVDADGDDERDPGSAAGADGACYRISVADNGIGIEPEYAEQIFTIFQRLHARTEYEGTGIGLALAKRIVEFHGGTIWLDTDVEAGATFRFTLPAPVAGGPADPDPEVVDLDELLAADGLVGPAPAPTTTSAPQEAVP